MSVPDIQHALNLLRQKEVDAAISTLEKQVQELPAHLTAHVLLARAYESKRVWDKALKAWENAYFLMPNSPIVGEGKRRVHEKMEREGRGDSAPSATPPKAPTEATPRAKDAPASTPPSDSPEAPAESTAAEDTAAEDTAPEDTAATAAATDTADEAASGRVASPDSESRTPRAEPPAEPSAPSPAEQYLADDEDDEDEAPSAEAPSAEDLEEDPLYDATDESDASGEFRIPLPDMEPPRGGDEEDDAPSGQTTTADKALSELDKLRKQAEQEARSGGARPDLAQQVKQRQEEALPEEEGEEEEDEVTGDLDRLIRELESARIEPRPDLEEVPTPDLEDDDVEDLVSETLARIYAAQGQYREAARIYVKLASQEPAQARYHLENASDMREKAEAKEAGD